ncbi:hypothetical protein WAI453_011640 [Rhynchosporium graminicola]
MVSTKGEEIGCCEVFYHKSPCLYLPKSAPINTRGKMGLFSSNRSISSSNTEKRSLPSRGNASGLSVTSCLLRSRFLRSEASLRNLQQDPEEEFVGQINRQILLDIAFTNNKKPSAGPFD